MENLETISVVNNVIESYENQTQPETPYSPVAEINAAQDEILYDATATQKVPVWLDEEEETEPIILIFAPLGDPRYVEFANNTSLKIVDDGNSFTRTTAQALGKLWDNLVKDVEGVEWEGGEKPENWKECFDLLQFKIPTMNKYLVVACYEKSKTSDGKAVFGTSNERIVFADLYFNGEIVTTAHYLQKSNYEFANELEKTQKIPFSGKGKGLQAGSDIVLPNSVKGKAAIYDEYRVKDLVGDEYIVKEVVGFVGGIVPIRVKEAVIDFVAKSVLKEKKS